jgi:tetratricopeptide (TPR) repeat protein
MSFWRNTVVQPALNADVDALVAEQQELLRREPANPRPYFALGTLAHFRGDTEAAISLFQKAIELDPAYVAPLISLGRIYAIQERYAIAWRYACKAENLGDPSLLQQLDRYPAASKPSEHNPAQVQRSGSR